MRKASGSRSGFSVEAANPAAKPEGPPSRRKNSGSPAGVVPRALVKALNVREEWLVPAK